MIFWDMDVTTFVGVTHAKDKIPIIWLFLQTRNPIKYYTWIILDNIFSPKNSYIKIYKNDMLPLRRALQNVYNV